MLIAAAAARPEPEADQRLGEQPRDDLPAVSPSRRAAASAANAAGSADGRRDSCSTSTFSGLTCTPNGRPSTAGNSQLPSVVSALKPGRWNTVACTCRGTPCTVVWYGSEWTIAPTNSNGSPRRNTHRGTARAIARPTDRAERRRETRATRRRNPRHRPAASRPPSAEGSPGSDSCCSGPVTGASGLASSEASIASRLPAGAVCVDLRQQNRGRQKDSSTIGASITRSPTDDGAVGSPARP